MNPVSQNTTTNWYTALEKPGFAPPPYVFGIAWGILYPIIFVSFGTVFYKALKKQIPPIIALPFALNLLFNFLFSPIQFSLQSNILAAADILLVVVTLVWAMTAIYPHNKYLSFVQIPYLLWGLFATTLQLSITYLNI